LPLYAYRCTKCGYQYEKVQKFNAEPETVCPQCGGGPVERPLTAPALQFKGAGWYINDYAPKPAAGSSAKGTPDTAAKPAGDSAAKTESSSTPAPASSSAPASSGSSE
jgi:putative FmdB family regulatory protein